MIAGNLCKGKYRSQSEVCRQNRLETEQAIMLTYRREFERKRKTRNAIEDLELARQNKEVWELAPCLDRSIPSA